MDSPLTLDRLTCDQIHARLLPAACRRGPVAELAGAASEPAERAAVLLPLHRLQGAWHLVFIRRAERAHDLHSGQVGFPGGRRQAGDPDCIATALREAQEEIGLVPERVLVLGQLRPMLTVSRFLVTPVVGCIPWPQPLVPDPREVARIFSIPLAWLGEHAHRRIRPYPHPDHPQARALVFFDDYDGETLWGVTARMTVDFLSCLEQSLGTGVAPEPPPDCG
ncbi:NUDIX hydrolase [Lamprocystis purpurea]|uniref:NUDIX hydrolase n=1 Tax=Lamprocystis purpurea TaxID=61598 RepID=UPI0003776CA1|nr:CoA pyrophosphatase [Lamprocystis purpurea]